MYEHKDNSGTFRKNDRKEKETHADLRGDGKMFGKNVWINVWMKKDKNGNPYYSMSIREKENFTQNKAAEEDVPW